MAIIQIPGSLLFTPNRACAGPAAVVLHSYGSGIEMLDLEMDRCPRPRPLTSPGCHTSFHFGVGSCTTHQYVGLQDTAWGFYQIPTPSCPTPPCPIVQTCNGVGADQYNPDADGGPATPGFGAGPDGTANCAVIHVALTGTGSSTSGGIFCINGPIFNERAYKCLVQSLCEIFRAAELVAIEGTTLLTHVGELYDLNLAQLAEDINECLVTPVTPPTPCVICPPADIDVLDTSTINLTLASDTLSGVVRVSSDAGNIIDVVADGLFAEINVTDTPTVDLTLTGDNTISADVNVSADDGNQIIVNPDGLYVPPFLEDSPECSDSLPSVTVVLGADGEGGWVWGTPARGKMLVEAVEDGDTIVPGTADVYTFSGADEGTVELSDVDGECTITDIHIKNLSSENLTITSSSLIDGVAGIVLTGTIPTGYPFGNNGGDSVHLVWTGTTWIVI